MLLTIEQAAEKPNCPYSATTLRDYIAKGKIRRILNPGGGGEYYKIGGKIRIVEERFDLWIHRRTFEGSEASLRGVPMRSTRRRHNHGPL